MKKTFLDLGRLVLVSFSGMGTLLTSGCNDTEVIYTLIRSTDEPAGANCKYGGVKLDTGLDKNKNGILDASEVSKTSYACGMRVDGKTGLTVVSDEPAGLNCPYGGSKIVAGLDVNDDGQLATSEVESTAYACQGDPGEDGRDGQDGADGTDGTNGINGTNGLLSLIRLTPVAPDSDGVCLFGGTRIDAGVDTNKNGVLDAWEITATQYVCSVSVNPNLTLVKNTLVQPGPICEFGGVRTEVGYDTDNDHNLDASEVTSETTQCNQVMLISGKTSLASTIPATTAQCAFGGVVLRVGLDDNYDQTLSASEVDSTTLLCNGSDGFSALTKQSPYSGPLCGPEGGLSFQSGLDFNRNNILESSEVQSTSTICHGTDGQDGQDGFVGYDGLNSLIKVEDAGSACGTYGGLRLLTGLDDDEDGYLDYSEIEQTSYVCHGMDGLNSLVYLADAGGACGDYGGTKISVGLDADEDGFLDYSEVEQSSYVCNGFDGYNALVEVYEDDPYECGDAGGVTVEVGLDEDANGLLSSWEVTSSAVVCNGADAW